MRNRKVTYIPHQNKNTARSAWKPAETLPWGWGRILPGLDMTFMETRAGKMKKKAG